MKAIWTPTMELRWNNKATFCYPECIINFLEQKWISNKGAIRWLPIPIQD